MRLPQRADFSRDEPQTAKISRRNPVIRRGQLVFSPGLKTCLWEDSCMSLVLGITHHAGVRLAEVAFLLLVIAGIWLAASEFLAPNRWGAFRRVVAGIALAVGGVLLIVAAHWGHFG